jgi:hypothetical protein
LPASRAEYFIAMLSPANISRRGETKIALNEPRVGGKKKLPWKNKGVDGREHDPRPVQH